MNNRKYLPSLAELLDRLTINQIKEVKLPKEHQKLYSKEIEDILHDIDLIIAENNIQINAKMIRAIIVLAQINLHIWVNEANCRNGIKEGNDLELTHSLNGLRTYAKNLIQKLHGGSKLDHKIDCLGENSQIWKISW
jgi:hypothetical protein